MTILDHVQLIVLLLSFIPINFLEFKTVDEADKDLENNSCEMDTDATAPIVHDVMQQK